MNECTYKNLERGLVQTKAGLIIGRAYSKRPELGGDDFQIQAALLDKRTAQAPTLLRRVAVAVLGWL
jgi:hypothetical protein